MQLFSIQVPTLYWCCVSQVLSCAWRSSRLLQFGEIIFLLVEITANEGLERSLIDPEEEAEKHMLKLCKDWIDKQP